MNNRLFLSLILTAFIIAITSCSPKQDEILVLTERGGQHGPFTDAALEWLAKEAAENGIIVKGGKFLEEASKADTVIFDKTGTLTYALPRLAKIYSFTEKSEDEVLALAACLEEHFAHPIASAIVKAAEEKGILHPEEHAKVEYIVAHGIASKLNEKKLLIGSRHFILDDEK